MYNLKKDNFGGKDFSAKMHSCMLGRKNLAKVSRLDSVIVYFTSLG